MTRLLALLCLAACAASAAAPRIVQLPGKSPVVTLRFVFTTGAASDPADQPGAANLTAEMLGHSGTQQLTYQQILDAMYPMASSVQVYTDKEMTTFIGETHRDNLDRFYGLMRDMILKPGWRAEDFARVRDESVNFLRINLRGNNDEELGKEALYSMIYRGRPYAHHNAGAVAALKRMTVDDLKSFYQRHYTQSNLILGIAGGYTPEFLAHVKQDFSVLPDGPADHFDLPPPSPVERNSVTLIEKDTRSVAWSLGFPIAVKRGDPDYPALLVMQSYLGQHRTHCRLMTRMREIRGLNYGDYAYIEYFPRGMFLFDPEPNLARRRQIFQIWIRPVEPPNAAFALRLAMWELNRLITDGLTEREFIETRTFLSKYVNVLTKTKSSELGYQVDSTYYGIPSYDEYVKSALTTLTVDDVNKAIRRHLHPDRLQIVGVAQDVASLRAQLTGAAPTEMHYNAAKPGEILAEDKKVNAMPFGIAPADITVLPVANVFEN